MISINDLTVSFDKNIVFKNISFDVEQGEIVVIVGSSGTGKTTLLRCINGLTSPTNGTVYVNEETVTKTRDDIAMVFQDPNLINHMTSYSNTLMGALGRTSLIKSLFQIYTDRERTKAVNALKKVGLDKAVQQRVYKLSGGQKQRVGIARAVLQEPNVLIVDEPTASLDIDTAHHILKTIRLLHKEEGLTTVVSEHNINLALEYADRIVGIKGTSIYLDSPVGDLSEDELLSVYNLESTN
jgi:phosphonate transport system ATP-binding protein